MFEVVLEATWRMLMSSFIELSMLIFSLQCIFLLTWSVLSQLSWEWNPQAPPLFYGTKWAWDPWGLYRPLGRYSGFYFTNQSQTQLWLLSLKGKKLFFELSLKSNTCGWRRIYLSISIISIGTVVVFFKISITLGSLHTRHFCTRYCDKKILR